MRLQIDACIFLTGLFHQLLLGANGGSGVLRVRLALNVGAVGLQVPCLALIANGGVENLLEFLLEQVVVNGGNAFDAVIKVAVHPVSGPDVIFEVAIVVEVVDA